MNLKIRVTMLLSNQHSDFLFWKFARDSSKMMSLSKYGTELFEKRTALNFRKKCDQIISKLLIPIQRKLYTESSESLKRLINVITETPNLAKPLLRDGAGKPIGDIKMSELRLTNILAGRVLGVYFNEAKSTVFNERVFDIVFDRLITDIESPTRKVRDINPLINVRLVNCDCLEIAPNLVIRALTNDELETWFNEYIYNPFLVIGGGMGINFTNLTCALEATYIQNRYEAWGDPKYREGIINLLTALRIVSDKNIHISFTEQNSNGLFISQGGPSYSLRPRLSGAIADIDSSMQQSIITIWKGISSLTNTRWRLALKRWDSVSERFDQYDMLIDYWVALESLFSDSREEIKYRASLRIAALIGSTQEECLQLYKDMRASYDLRSTIIHGKIPDGHESNDLISKTRLCLRRALLKILSGDDFNYNSLEIELLRKFKS